MKSKIFYWILALAYQSAVWAGERLPFLPTYHPSEGEIYTAASYTLSKQESETSVYGSGISGVPHATAKANGAALAFQYGVTDALRIGFAAPYTDAKSTWSTGISSETSGWGSPSFSLTKDVLVSTQEILAVRLGFTPKLGDSVFNRYQSTSVSGQYSHLLGNRIWGAVSAGFVFRPGSQPESAAFSAALVQDLGQYSAMVGIGANKVQDSHLNTISRSERFVDWSLNAGVGSKVNQQWGWDIRYVYGTSRAYERLDSGAGYLDWKNSSHAVQISLLKHVNW